jgi:2-dehydropantoate 2-reductase
MNDSQSRPSVAIIGSGALACLFAARLSRVGSVELIGSWQQQIESINERGITISELDGSVNTTRTRATLQSSIPSQPEPVDYALVLVKSYQASQAIERLQRYCQSHTIILTLQNGLGNKEQFSAAFPDHFVSAGVTMQGANIDSAGTVVHAGNGSTVIDDHPRLTTLLNLFRQAALPTETAQGTGAMSIDEVLWRKLIINTAINPLTALLGQPNGYMVEHPDARALSEATARETAVIAQREGAWPDTDVERAATLATDAASITRANRSSMLQDVSRGNRTEIAAICGEVVSRARRHQLDAPLNRLWLELIGALESAGKATDGRAVHAASALARMAAEQST